MAIHYFTASTAAALKTSRRECPACQHRQQVSAAKKDQPVVCTRCGAQIPPKPKSNS
jgi:uncharacterized paraquat-inducible protein A